MALMHGPFSLLSCIDAVMVIVIVTVMLMAMTMVIMILMCASMGMCVKCVWLRM